MKVAQPPLSAMASPSHRTATELVVEATSFGFNLVGFLGSPQFDACQPCGRRAADLLPTCGTIFLVGTGGPGFWRRLQDRGVDLAQPRPDHHPIHDYCVAAAARLVAWLGERGVQARAAYPDDAPPLNMMQMAEMAGWGTVSPVLGILLHPEFGPWLSIRLALLIEGTPFGVIDGEEHQPFQPCFLCQKPCVAACPVQVFDGLGGVRIEACARHRQAGECADGCDARRACPVGATARYGPDEERFRHAYSLFAMQRHFGWRPAADRGC